jgi:Glycosyltransferase family 25 (LPS biosynthesis protein)
MGLFKTYNVAVEQAYIITIEGDEVSERYSKQCQESCEAVGQPYTVWPAFNGHTDPITVPDHSKNSDIINLLKITDHYLTRTEVACVLSHVSLWIRCMLLDQPIVILEHDAVMLKPFTQIERYNSIVWLGSVEWAEQNWPMLSIPLHGSEGPNYHFLLRAHAYAIDPPMAKNLVSYVIEHGICTSADVMLRADLFNISHQGLFAYDKHDVPWHKTTITNRLDNKRGKKRNDKLDF